MKRPELNYELISQFDVDRPELSEEVIEQVEINIKYAGYIERELRQVEQFKKMEKKLLPENLNYEEISGLRKEAQQKLAKYSPHSVGQAMRISGVSPADITVLLVYLEQRGRK